MQFYDALQQAPRSPNRIDRGSSSGKLATLLRLSSCLQGLGVRSLRSMGLVDVLLDGIRGNSSLERLDVGDFDLPVGDFARLLGAAHDSLLRWLNVSHNIVEAADRGSIAALIQRSPSLTHLDVSHCGLVALGPRDATSWLYRLGDVLRLPRLPLISLVLDGNNLGDGGIFDLAAGYARGKDGVSRLRPLCLSLKDCSITEESAEHLRKIIGKSVFCYVSSSSNMV